MRILVIEDEPEVAEFVKKVLTEDHHAVDVAADGSAGEYLASTENYDLVVLDIMLLQKKMD